MANVQWIDEEWEGEDYDRPYAGLGTRIFTINQKLKRLEMITVQRDRLVQQVSDLEDEINQDKVSLEIE